MRIEVFENRIIKPWEPKVKDGWYILEPEKKKRSNQQNKLLHGQLFPEAARAISKKTGRKISTEFAKSLLKTKFAIEYDEQLGEYILPTSKMDKARCCKFVEDSVRYIAVFCNYYIELPGDWENQIK